MSIFSERIKNLKTSKKILQKDIAKEIGVSLRAYQYYENDQREPTMSVLLALAEYFDVSLDYLIGKTNNPNVIVEDKKNDDKYNLTKEESELLEDFRILDKYEKNIIMGKISEIIYNKSVEASNLEVENSDELVNIALRDRLNK